MATALSHLLTIPREIRDLIYPYLHQEIRFFWIEKYQHVAPYDDASSYPHLPDECEIRLPQAPLLSVLLTHSRLKAEYMETYHFKHPTAIIRARQNGRFGGIDTMTYYSRWTTSYPSTWPVIETALARARQVDIFFDCYHNAQDNFYPETEDASGLGSIVEVVTRSAPFLTTFRIAITYGILGIDQRPQHPHERDYAHFNPKYFLPTPPLKCALLPLVQRAEGFHTDDKRNPEVHHLRTRRDGFKDGCYVYSLATSGISFWTPEDMIYEWKLRLKRRTYDKIPPWRRGGPVSVESMPEPTLPPGFAAWREKRGAINAARWFEDLED